MNEKFDDLIAGIPYLFRFSQKTLTERVLIDIEKSGIMSIVILENPCQSGYHCYVSPGEKPFSKFWKLV